MGESFKLTMICEVGRVFYYFDLNYDEGTLLLRGVYINVRLLLLLRTELGWTITTLIINHELNGMTCIHTYMKAVVGDGEVE